VDRLLTLDWGQTLERVQDLIRNPQSNVVASILLLAAFSIVVLLIFLSVGMLLLGGSDEDEGQDDEEWEVEGVDAGDAPSGGRSPSVVTVDALEAPGPKRPLWIRIGVFLAWSILVVGVVWGLAGVTTAQSSVCLSCHADNPHSKAQADPHQAVRCVSCHEQGGVAVTVTTAVPARAVHFVSGILKTGALNEYGRNVSSDACTDCHSGAMRETLSVQDRGIRISHREPLDAGAECLDCHAPADGVISNHTVGMAPCLRCHDGATASTECETCHTRPIGTAAEPGQSSSRQALDRIGQPDCGTCHDQKKCDACHGIRMPHTKDFMAYGHARAAAEDIWNNGGKGCAKCHTATRRPCLKCHTNSFPQHPVKEWKKSHGAGGPNNNACICHEKMAYIKGRNYCGLCHEVTQKNGVWQMAPQ
jgi:hypothetical protein